MAEEIEPTGAAASPQAASSPADGSVVEAELGPSDVVTATDPAADPAPKRRPRVAVVLLSVALGLAVIAIAALVTLLVLASNRLDEQDEKIEDQEELIEQKETFGAAMQKLVDTARTFEGTLMGDLVPVEEYARLADLAWAHRWTSAALDRDTQRVDQERVALETLRADAQAQTSTNATGSAYETAIDSLGAGFVASLLDDADTLCEDDVLACVAGDDPYAVHFDQADAGLPYMTDFIKTGIAYHEFAHVLQFTNPGPTEIALEAFGGDPETMADCFALTYLSGWTLDHTVWVSSVEYWEVSIGYGYTCDSTQRAVVQDWYDQLGVTIEPITQS